MVDFKCESSCFHRRERGSILVLALLVSAAASVAGDVHLISGEGHRLWRRSLPGRCRDLTTHGASLCVALESGDAVWLNIQDGEPVARVAWAGPVTRLLPLGGGVLAAGPEGLVTRLCL